MTKEKDPNGLVTENRYDAMGNLTETISPKGAKTAYTYDKHDELTSETDPAGNTILYQVDLNRQVTKLTQKNGGVYTYEYDLVHRLTGMTTPLGLNQTFSYDLADNVTEETDNLGRTVSYEYDSMHRMTSSTNAKGGVTQFAYDERGNQTAVTDPSGYTWSSSYDLANQLIGQTDPEGKATKYTYNLAGRLLSRTKPGERTATVTYDKNYNVISLTDPKGYVYSYTYDKDNRQTEGKDPLEQSVKTAYDPGSRVTAVTDKMGLTEQYEYDPHGNIIQRTDTKGLHTRFQYDILDNLTAVTDPMNRKTSYTYDVMGNILTMADPKNRVTSYTYDLEGNLTSLTSPMGRKETYEYDAGGRQIQKLNPGGSRIRYDYDTLNALADKKYEDARGEESDHPVQMGYNSMGQRISMEDITGGSSYTYDSLGRLKTAVNGSGKTVSYEYDEADNLGAVIYPDGKRVSYEYDKNDNITRLTDRDGRETSYEYDPLNRLTQVKRPDGTVSSYIYNARNQVLEAKNTCVCGFLISDYQYTYNDGGLIIEETAKECLFTSNKDYGHQGGELDPCIHASTNPWQNQNPEWETTERRFTYDENGQLLTCQESKGAFDKTTYTYEYDEAGNRTFAKKEKLYSYLESWQIRYTYNDDNQMAAAKKREGNLTKEYAFTYDANGNLLRECFKNKPEVTYQYDTENRLKAVSDPQKLLMASTYDGDGNRAFQLNYNPDAECGYGKNVNGEIFMPEHSHNEDGSLTAEGELFGYICSATGRAYDLTEYVNDTNREYAEVLTAFNINTGFDTESYTYAGSSRLSRNNIWNEARDVNHDEMSYYLYDGQGSVTANTWYNGMVTDVYQYDPYGRMELGGEGHTDFYGYRAESYNPNTGLEYLRARYYNADKGRFFQEDTYLGDITDPLTLNRYAYVKNSPLNYADPSGHVAEYLTGPQYNPNDGWQANYYPLSQTGPEKTEFPIEIVSGTEAVKAFWGSVSEGLDHVMSQLKEAADLSLSQLRELRGWMKEAVEHSVVNVCENRGDLGAEIGETLLALISGALMGIDNAFNVPTDTMDEFFSSHALAYNIGKILGKSGTIAVLSLLAGLFLGGGAAAAGGATLALGGAMVAVTSSAIAIEWSALTAGSLSLSVSDHSSGSGEAEEGESYSYKNGTYEKADYHSGQTTGKKNPAPKDGQFALDNSVPIGDNTTRRVGIDSNGDFVVFDETSPGTFHGHIRTWNRSNGNQGLTQAMKNALYDAGYIKSSKGTSFKLTDYVKELIGK